mmetsp:Transcript_22757/g.21950  ORF Transcript_22757/g.21950 Transcript_22757/m.21950 type:complete len:130 (+) Transcript_22757:289-678(+)|eukprot:CAMPEP_0170566458 /NCGR_PEP_ID=MMETSP0211-20121228/79851_1 /TAXON_ID=311385 /ORGANISM="Pseudokeronopsis sp., Strain OXSARD2" /LENGTH=129 /DNA_ID=CAMNT_0010887641 /DNA_START=1212 /DNA_END=1601 /DNA_ORIENTATION=-
MIDMHSNGHSNLQDESINQLIQKGAYLLRHGKETLEEHQVIIGKIERAELEFADMEQVETILVQLARMQKDYQETSKGVQEQAIIVQKLGVLRGGFGWKIVVPKAFNEKMQQVAELKKKMSEQGQKIKE